MRTRAQRWFSLTFLASLLASPMSVMAQQSAEGPGLDLVVLVDRSTSMSGPGRKVRSDPHPVTDLLGLTLDAVARNAESNRVSHRLGVVSFGSAARVDLPLVEIQRADLDRWRHTIAALPPRESLGNTNILAAFAAAAKVFQALPADPERKRAILLLTDGVPYVPGTDATEYSRELRRFVGAHFTSPQTTIEVVLAPSGRSGGQPYSRLWRDLSQDRVHELAGDRSNGLTVIYRVVTRLLGIRAVESRPAGAGDASVETLVLPPYLDLVVFDILRGPRAVEVAVFAPDTLRPLTAEAEGVEEIRLGEALWTLVVRRPAPGLWTFRKSHPDVRVKVLSQQFFPRGLLVDPAAEPHLQYDRVSVAYRMVDGNGSPVKELPGYPLSLDLSLVKPDGSRDALGMRPEPKLGPAVFQTQKKSECDLAGRYWTEVVVTTKDLNDQRVTVFQDHWSGFSVEAASRIDCRVTAPNRGEPGFYRHQLLWSRLLDTRLECLDMKAQPVEMTSIVRGSPTGLFQPSLSHEGQPTAAVLDLKYLGRGTFQGWLRGAESPGSYQLQLAVDRSRLSAPYNIRFLPSDTVFVRSLSWLDWSLILVLTVAVLACLVWIGRTVWKRRWESSPT